MQHFRYNSYAFVLRFFVCFLRAGFILWWSFFSYYVYINGSLSCIFMDWPLPKEDLGLWVFNFMFI